MIRKKVSLSSTEIKEKKHFNKMALKYDDNYGYNLPFTKYKINKKSKEFKEMVNQFFSEGKVNILEIGCGTGEYTKQISTMLPKANFTCLDISEKSVDVAKSKCRKRNNVKFGVGSAYNTNFKSNSFDVVCGFYILHHLDFKKALKEVNRILKPGGRIFFYEPNILNPIVYLIKSNKTLKRLVGDSPNEWAMNPVTINTKLKYFKSISIKSTEFIVPLSFLPLTILIILDNITGLLSHVPLINMFGGSIKIHLQKL